MIVLDKLNFYTYFLNYDFLICENCFRFDGAAVIVTKGDKNLNTCNLLDHNKNKALAKGIYSPLADQQVVKIYKKF